MPKKSLGQNFLIDHNIAKKIANLISSQNNYNLIEVGPGKGFLTDYLISKKAKRIFLIEKDVYLYNELKEKYNKNKKVIIYNEDALKSDRIDNINKPKIIVSNLPYNISIKLIINWLTKINDFHSLYLMIQKEVAYKFKYKNISKLNRLNIFCQLMSDYKIEFNVSPNVFYPKPKVFSSVVSFKKNIKEKINVFKFQKFTMNLFSSKRKIIMNNLIRNKEYKKKLNNKKNINVDLLKRAEDLDFKEVMILYKFLH